MGFISFIGCGNMGLGMVTAACNNKSLNKQEIFITDTDRQKVEAASKSLGCSIAASNDEAVKNATYIVLCVKPQVLPMVLSQMMPTIKDCIDKGEKKVLVSIAAGVTIDTIAGITKLSYDTLPIIRLLPNLPASIGCGLISCSIDNDSAKPYLTELMDILQCAGKLVSIPESQMDAAGVIGGCVPAFAYMFIESMADGAVMAGMSRPQAIEFAAQAVLGAASMVLETGQHPEQLKDAVCSPAGTTIAGVKALEENGFRNASFQAVYQAYEKSCALSKK